MIRFGLLIATVWFASLCSVTFAQDRGFASAIEWSPDGETIAVASSTGVWFFDAEFNELGYVEVKQGKWDYSPRSLEWNASGDLVAIAYPSIMDLETPTQIVDVGTLEVVNEIETQTLGLWTQLEWHPKENLIAAGSWSGESFVWDALTGEQVFYFQDSADQYGWPISTTLAVCWMTDRVIVVVTEWETYIVDIQLNETLQTFDIRTQGRAACHRDYRIKGGAYEIIDLKNGNRQYFVSNDEVEPIEVLMPQDTEWVDYALDIEFSPDGSKIIKIGEGCRLAVYDGHNGSLLAVIRGGILIVVGPFVIPYLDSLTWHPDGSRFAAVGQFGGIRIWDAETYELLQIYDGFEAGYGELSAYIEILKTKQSADLPDAREIEAMKARCIEELDSAALGA